MLVGSLCLIASSLNVGQEYLSSAPNNRFISRFLKTPKMCHMHEETNLSSCICIFFTPIFSLLSFFGGGERGFWALCMLDIFLFLVILYLLLLLLLLQLSIWKAYSKIYPYILTRTYVTFHYRINSSSNKE